MTADSGGGVSGGGDRFSTRAWPEEDRVRPGGSALAIRFEDGAAYELPAEYLRVESPSAEVQGHGPSQKVLVDGKAAVRIAGVEPVGRYAVRLRFDDGHDTGLYSWTYLATLGREHGQRWPAYVAALRAAGKSRSEAAV